MILKGALGKELPEKADAQLARLQAPLANFWLHLIEQEFTGKTDELILISDVIRVTQDTLAPIGNASNYISQARCSTVINSIARSQPKLSSFLKEICKADLGDTGDGPEVRKKIMQRASTIEAFNKATSRVVTLIIILLPYLAEFFYPNRPATKYRGEPGRNYTPYNKFRQHKEGYRGYKCYKDPFQPQKVQNLKRKDWGTNTNQ